MDSDSLERLIEEYEESAYEEPNWESLAEVPEAIRQERMEYDGDQAFHLLRQTYFDYIPESGEIIEDFQIGELSTLPLDLDDYFSVHEEFPEGNVIIYEPARPSELNICKVYEEGILTRMITDDRIITLSGVVCGQSPIQDLKSGLQAILNEKLETAKAGKKSDVSFEFYTESFPKS